MHLVTLVSGLWPVALNNDGRFVFSWVVREVRKFN